LLPHSLGLLTLVGLLTHLPSAAESEPDVYNIYGEQFWQHLMESKRTPAAEEYRWLYCTLAYQHNSQQALEEIIGSTLVPGTRDHDLLRPLLNTIKAITDLHIHRLILLRLRSGAVPDSDPAIVEAVVRDAYGKPAAYTPVQSIQSVITKYRDSSTAALLRQAAKASAEGNFISSFSKPTDTQAPSSKQRSDLRQ
jgi:hypothetical protein